MFGECEFLKECKVKITADFFDRICTTRSCVNCHHRAKILGQLLEPLGWLTSINEVGGSSYRMTTKVSYILRKIEGEAK